jgi:UDP-GlcNAc:undecaprenyl-phosphate/decaprenyl-phosphate GlcNAc-1-phosphate transferase
MLILLDLAGIAFLFSLVLTPYVRDAARKLNLVDHPDALRKIHAEPIPRVGGVAIVIAYFLSFGFILVAPYRGLSFDIHAVLPRALVLLPAAGVMFAVGLIDDLWGLKPWQKLAGQMAAALLAFWAGVRIDFLGWHQLRFWIGFPVTIIWLVGCANAFNLIDGLDGLAAGVGLFATLTTLVAALTHNSLQLALVTAPLAGCLLGFLRYNFNPASIFLGDSGSLLIGFLLGCYGVMWSDKSATLIGLTAPMMAMAIPLLDVVLSIVRRFLRNQPIFGADRGHIHHRLLAKGLTPRGAAWCLYGICGIAAALSLLQDLVHDRAGGAIIVLFCIVTWIGVQHLGYAEFGIAGRLFVKGTLRSFVNVQLRLHEFEASLAACSSVEEYCTTIVEAGRQFGFSGVRIRLAGQTVDQAPPGYPTWQLRIEFPDLQYVNIYGSQHSSQNPGLVTGFAQIIDRVLTAKGLIARPLAPAPAPVALPVPAEAGVLSMPAKAGMGAKATAASPLSL